MSSSGADVEALVTLSMAVSRAASAIEDDVDRAVRAVTRCGGHGHRALLLARDLAEDIAGLARRIADQARSFADADHPAPAGVMAGLSVATTSKMNQLGAARSEARQALVAEVARLTRRGDEVPRHLAALLDPSRQILLFDPAGEGRVVEAFGDVATADHVAVVVPGMGSDLAGFDSHVAAKARRLAVDAAGLGNGSVATIAWLGYDAPDAIGSDPSWVAEVTTAALAVSGGEQLSGFIDWLELEVDTHVTVVGHSYGSLTAAHAARQQPAIDDVLITGSPGVGGRVSRSGDQPELWTMEAPADVVADIGWFGGDPNDPGSGWTRLATGPEPGHDAYLQPGTESLANAAMVVVGLGAAASVAPRSPIERAWTPVDRAIGVVDRGTRNNVGRVPVLVPPVVGTGVDVGDVLTVAGRTDDIVESGYDLLDAVLPDLPRPRFGW